MQQIAGWREKLGLGQYAPRFAENDINFAILSDLTDHDLTELEVSSRRAWLEIVRRPTEAAFAAASAAAAFIKPATRSSASGGFSH
jgi:hypothetical protein